jgi:2-methylisocitrate lyase-like PEP mutase family enzyme
MPQHQLAARFRRLHAAGSDQILVLPNAWDAMSARVVEDAGASAIATTSAGVSWALGYPDGHGLSRDAMIEAVRRMVQCVRVPVTADVESGYGTGSPEDVAATVRGVIGAGAVGVNFEDSPGHHGEVLLDTDVHAARLTAAREAARDAGVDLFINARVDTYLRKVGSESERFAITVQRAHAYRAAGADGIFVPLVSDAETIGRLVHEVGAPLNVIAGPGSPTIAELKALGVARVSVGPGLARAVMAHIRRAAKELLGAGTYTELADQFTSPEANGLFNPARS